MMRHNEYRWICCHSKCQELFDESTYEWVAPKKRISINDTDGVVESARSHIFWSHHPVEIRCRQVENGVVVEPEFTLWTFRNGLER